MKILKIEMLKNEILENEILEMRSLKMKYLKMRCLKMKFQKASPKIYLIIILGLAFYILSKDLLFLLQYFP